MEKKIVDCPYSSVPFNKVPGYEYNIEKCPYCGSTEKGFKEKKNSKEQLINKEVCVHNKIERTFLTKDEATVIFMKYIKKHYIDTYDGGSEILEAAWYSQHWPTYARHQHHYNPHPKRDWMKEDLLLAFDWYLDAVGRDLGLGYGRAKELIPREEINQLKKELNKYGSDLRHDKWERQRKSKEKSEAKQEAHGKEVMKSVNIGDVVIVKFPRNINNERGIQVLEIEDDYIAGFYLDWDNKNQVFKKTRTYETKMIKFIKRKFENPTIVKK